MAKVIKSKKGALESESRYRYAQVEANSADEKKRTLQVAFSSEFPVERTASARDEKLGIAKRGEEYLELLSHNEGDYDISALNAPGAFVDEHDTRAHIGPVTRAEVSADKRGRAVIGFDGASELSKVRFNQMSGTSPSRPHISFDYKISRFISDEVLSDGRTAKRVAWKALGEISSVAEPADYNAGVSRSAGNEYCHCTRCGGMFERAELDDDFRCEDCGPVARHLKENNSKVTRDAADKVTLSELACQVDSAVSKDPRFHGKGTDGEPMGWTSIRDLFYDEEAKTWSAVVYCGTDGKTYEVGFTVADNVVTLGESVEVEPKVTYEPVADDDDERKKEAGKTRSETPSPAPTVDSPKLATGDNKPENLTRTNNIMADTPTNTIDEKQIRSAERAAVENEFKTRSAKVDARNKEIHARANEFVKQYGQNWAGNPGEVVVVGERIRAFESEACSQPADASDSEVRMEFTRKADELCRSSRPPKNQQEAAIMPNEVASRCSLRRLYNEGIRAADRGQRSQMFMLTDGAEAEAHKEIHNRAKDFPGGTSGLGQGMVLPLNMPSGIRRNSSSNGRVTRDALAGDFATAGALIAPEFIWPTIELLRNLPALARSGMTMITGVMGDLVLPRQEAATTVQSIAEGAQLTAYDQALGQIKMSPNRVGSRQNYSRLALLQTTPDFEAMVMRDHLAQIALYIDEMGLNGQGGTQPLGILNQLGIGSVYFGGSAASAYKNAIAMETAIRSANIYDPVSFITTSKVRGQLRVTPATLTGSTVVSGQTNAIWTDAEGSDDGLCIGRSAVDSQQVPNDILVALVGRHLVMAQWGGLAVTLDTMTRADYDEYKLSINTYVDFALRHAQAVVRSADSLAVLS